MSEMTREEAIKRIEKMVEGDDELGCLFIRKDIEALNMAISALSAEGEYIKKEDTIEYLNDLFGEMYHVSFGNVLQSIDSLPTYSFPDREKGEWISREGTGECFPFWERHKCSKCGKYGEGTFNFCPNCGADMRGDKAND